MNPDEHKLVDLEDHFLTRRQFLQRAGMGISRSDRLMPEKAMNNLDIMK